MLSRRDTLLGMAGTMLTSAAHAAPPSSIAVTAAEVPRPALPASEQLMYSAVRLYNQTSDVLRWGTGFLFSLFNTTDSSVPVIVTNAHVVNGWDKCSFSLTGRRDDGTPDLEHHIPVEISQFSAAHIPHPNADLTIIPIAGLLEDLKKRNTAPFFITLDQSLIPTSDELNTLTPVEQIITVGFPGRIWDDVHNLPVFHVGYTESAPYIDFKGVKEFLIDITTWPGSSGSPVLLFNEGAYAGREGGLVVGTRIKLLGVAYGVATQDVTGDIVIQNAPTQIKMTGQMQVPTNLGACIMASRILEFEPILVARGFKPPQGYILRAK